MGALQNEPSAAPVAPLDQAGEANYYLKHPNIVNSCVCVRVCASEVAVQANMGKRRGGGALKGSNYLDAGSQAESQD